MRYLTSLIIAVFVGGLSACANNDMPADLDTDTFTDLKITLDRSACFGVCPSYVVNISGDGKVSYCGIDYVAETGLRTRQIDPTEVRLLYKEILSANFFKLQNSYFANITDNPSYIVSVTVDGRTKTVLDYVGRAVDMPETVTAIQKSIDKVAGTSDWLGERTYDYFQSVDTGRSECEETFRPY